MNKTISLIAALFLVVFNQPLAAGRGKSEFVAPVERSKFLTVTSYDSLHAFVQSLGSHPGIVLERIATSVKGREVTAVRVSSSPSFGVDTTKVRVLLFAQQHGDEPSGKEALTVLLAKLASGALEPLLRSLDLLIIPQMNPDGAELRQRRTSDSLDLNRDHLRLRSPETRGLHDLFCRWMPHVTVDIHEYGAFSSSWRDSGFIKRGDVQLGMLTNLNTPPGVRRFQHEGVAPFIAESMTQRGYSFHEYIVGSPQTRIRHSTTEINDGRQSFGVLGSISFIQEGWGGKTLQDQLERRVLSQLVSVEALLEFCSANAAEAKAIVATERQRLLNMTAHNVVVRMDHYPCSSTMEIPVKMLATNVDTVWTVKPYHGEVRALYSVSLPRSYSILRHDSVIVSLLDRHHVKIDTVKWEARIEASRYLIDSVGAVEIEEDTIPNVFARPERLSLVLQPGDFIISTSQIQSLFLAIALEPESFWGLSKYPELGVLKRGREYPVLRIP